MIRFALFTALLLCALHFPAFAQENDATVLLAKVKEKFSTVQDYEVQVHLKIDVSFLKVPETDATIFYKQPNKVHVKTDGFALMPKQGLNFSPLELLNGNYQAFYVSDEQVEGKPCAVVKVIPIGGSGDIVLTTLWINRKEYTISKVESTTKTNGTFTILLTYNPAVTNHPLPSSIVFTFNVPSFDLPKGMNGNVTEEEEKDKDSGKMTEGKVYITYSNYKVNKGIPDSVFEEKKK